MVILLSEPVYEQENIDQNVLLNGTLKSRMQDLSSLFFNLLLPFLSGIAGFLPTVLNKINNSRSQLK